MAKWTKPLPYEEPTLRKKLTERVNTLTVGEARVALDLLDQLVVCFDPDIVHDFTHWHSDPRLASIIQLAARLDDDLRDQVLFYVEDLFAAEKTAANKEND